MNYVIQGTVKELGHRYKDMPDEYILQEISMGRHAGEALFYLLFGRYADMLEIIYSQQSLTLMDFDDFMLELDIRMFKDECRAATHFKSEKASFKTYLSTIARNLLYDLREKELPTLDISALWDTFQDNDDGEEVIWLMEAINTYHNKDSRYVLLKTIEGYKSKEIAAMLTSRRHEEGTLKQDEELKPSYIDTLRSRALKAIRNRIFNKGKKYNAEVFEASICPSIAPPSMACGSLPDMSMPAAPMSRRVVPLLFKAGLFVNNIRNLYNQMMED